MAQPKKNATPPTADEAMNNAVYEAGNKALSEWTTVVSQAQRLFYEYWNAHGDESNIADAATHYKKCMHMAENIRKIGINDFDCRIKKYDKEIRGKARKSNIILPDASMWATWRPQ